MNNPLDFSGKVALVTGAAAGLGLATARAFAEAGEPGRAALCGGMPHRPAPVYRGIRMRGVSIGDNGITMPLVAVSSFFFR